MWDVWVEIHFPLWSGLCSEGALSQHDLMNAPFEALTSGCRCSSFFQEEATQWQK